MSFIKAINIQKHFDTVHVLKDLNFEVKKNSIVGIIGQSGAGKSTLIRCLNMIESVDSGSIYIDNQDITKFNKKDKRTLQSSIGMIFQGFNLLSRRTVLQNIMLPLEIKKVSQEEIKNRALECLGLVGLEHKKDAYPHQLSGGQKQRVAIARAITSNIKILLCDEPTSSLDSETTEDILLLIKKINMLHNITIVIITHEVKVTKNICDYVYVMKNGEIIEGNTTENILINPQHKYTKDLISNIFHTNIPKFIIDKLSILEEEKLNNILIRIMFYNDSSKESVIFKIATKHNIEINIISGNIDHIGEITFGTLIISTSKNNYDILQKEFIAYQIKINILGYF